MTTQHKYMIACGPFNSKKEAEKWFPELSSITSKDAMIVDEVWRSSRPCPPGSHSILLGLWTKKRAVEVLAILQDAVPESRVDDEPGPEDWEAIIMQASQNMKDLEKID